VEGSKRPRAQKDDGRTSRVKTVRHVPCERSQPSEWYKENQHEGRRTAVQESNHQTATTEAQALHGSRYYLKKSREGFTARLDLERALAD